MLVANLGWANLFRRPGDQIALAVIATSAVALIVSARFTGPRRDALPVLAQLPAGVVVGMLIQPSTSLLFALAIGTR